MSAEDAIRKSMAAWGASLFNRGFTVGSSGNISVRLDDGYLITPTNSCLGFLDPSRISLLDRAGMPVAGDPPSKEADLHLGFYRGRPSARAVVHLHSTFATAISCLADTDPANAIPPITPYVVMRVGAVPVIPYLRPGAPGIGDAIATTAQWHAAVLLANHGPVVAGASLESAVYAAEELEETAKIVMLTRGMEVRRLTREQIAELDETFRLR